MQTTITIKHIMTIVVLLIVLAVTITGIFLGYQYLQRPQFSQEITTEAQYQVSSVNFAKIELADDNSTRQMGLMNRTELCEACAMLFVFEEEDIQSFWMKNTYLSLDMIFIDSDGLIVTVHTNTTPQSTTSYTSTQPAKYVLEVNAGFANRNQLKVGSKLAIQDLIAQGVEFGQQ
jgi:uncharacterized membrane protein (UPF0127 family)